MLGAKEIGIRLRAARESLRLPAIALAEMIGVTRATVHNWETGKTIPDSVQLQRACMALAVGITELLDDTREFSVPHFGPLHFREDESHGRENV